MSKLYFVEEIFLNLEIDGGYMVCLCEANPNNENPLFTTIQTESIYLSNGKKMYEGQYVYYDGQQFTNGNSSSIARSESTKNGIYLKKLTEMSLQAVDNQIVDNASDVYSYHVNVGHGNCSIIVFKNNNKVNIWVIDCSIRERVNGGKFYKINLDDCISYIKKKHLNGSSFFINKFFLTHAHYDHYSGMEYLIDQKYIKSNTVCYINSKIAMACKAKNLILKKLIDIKPIVIEPISPNSNHNIDILHPCNSLSNRKIKKKYSINNTSTMLHVKLNDKSILFTGDIQEDAWKTFQSSHPSCRLDKLTYYCISHHGSLNGHPKSTYNIYNSIINCKRTILMGRDGAYPGIYSAKVKSDLSSNILYIQNDTFYEMEWSCNYTCVFYL